MREAKRLRNAQEAAAATAIQNAQRSRVARKRVASKRYDKMVRDEDAAARFRRREKAAKLLQRAGRGFVGRRRFGKRKKARDAEEARRHEAATTIQGLGRARSGRRAFEVRKKKKQREDLEAGKLVDEKAAQIQALYRGRRARVDVRERLEAKHDADKAKALKEKEKAKLEAQKEAQFRAAEKSASTARSAPPPPRSRPRAPRARRRVPRRAAKAEADRARALQAAKGVAVLTMQRAGRSYISRGAPRREEGESRLKAEGGAARTRSARWSSR